MLHARRAWRLVNEAAHSAHGADVVAGRSTTLARVRARVILIPAALAAAGVLAVAARTGSAAHASFVRIATGISVPTDITTAPGDPTTLYVVGQTGLVSKVRNGRVTGTFIDLRSIISSGGERGLLSLRFDPHYATNHLFYVSYTDRNGTSRVARYTAAHGVGVRSSARILLTVEQPFANHNGGQLQFDRRGYLYFGLGDGGSEGDPKQTSQDMSTKLGKLLRSATTTPDGNWKVVALGLRNPWRFSFDSANDNLWIGDVGQDHWEEIDFRPAGVLDRVANYGWSRYEGNAVYSSSHTYNPLGDRVSPTYVYSHGQGCSVTGGYVYRGPVKADRGRYFFGDYCAGTVWSFPTNAHGRSGPARVEGNVPNISAFGVDGTGNLYAASQNGAVYELR